MIKQGCYELELSRIGVINNIRCCGDMDVLLGGGKEKKW